MRATRGYWSTVAIAGTFTLLGVAATNPVLLAGGVTLGVWLLANQVAFLRTLRTLAASDLSVGTLRERVAVGEPVLIRLQAHLDEALPFGVSVDPTIPPSAECSEPSPTVSLEAGDRSVDTTFEVTSPLVGDLMLGPPRVAIRAAGGLFDTTIWTSTAAEVTVRPRAPRNLHVGEGGSPLTSRYGEHRSDTTGSGLEPYEVREYAPGDELSRIDWKATARLNHPHIREFELTTTHETVLVVDHRATMGVGLNDESKLDYLRGIAHSFINAATSFGDPLGLYTVGDEGTTTTRKPTAGIESYDPIRGLIENIEPTESNVRKGSDDVSPSRARNRASRLDDGSALGATLRPYFETTTTYVRRLRERPLFRTMQLAHSRLGGGAWTVLLTDDTNPTEVREAIKLARRNGGQVLVFLAPSVLYEPGGLDDLNQAYDRYLTFEEFRASLARMDRVSAFEVAPGDRLDAVIDRHGAPTRRERSRDVARASRRYQEYGENPRQGLAYGDDPMRSSEGGHTDE